MNNKTTYYEDNDIDHILRNQAFTPPPTVYGEIWTANPTEAGLHTNEVGASLGYARPSVALAAASAGATNNSAQLDFGTATGSWGAVTYAGLVDGSTLGAGNVLVYGKLANNWQEGYALVDDLIYVPSHGRVNDDNVVIEPILGNSLPTGLVEGTLYWVVSATANSFSVSLTQGGGAVDVTAAGILRVGTDKRKTIATDDQLLINATNLTFTVN